RRLWQRLADPASRDSEPVQAPQNQRCLQSRTRLWPEVDGPGGFLPGSGAFWAGIGLAMEGNVPFVRTEESGDARRHEIPDVRSEHRIQDGALLCPESGRV